MSALWHVTTMARLRRYLATGAILPPVRAWESEQAAARFSRQTGRRVILRLVRGRGWTRLDGHRGEALVLESPYRLEGM